MICSVIESSANFPAQVFGSPCDCLASGEIAAMTKFGPRLVVSVVICLALFDVCTGQQLSLPFRRGVEADKDKTYWLTEHEGPWLIMCASFAGENAIYQAKDLVHELRSKHNLKAYVFKKNIDFPDTVPGAGMGTVKIVGDGQILARSPEMEFAHGHDFEEIAVLVGNFSSFDDRGAADTLEKIKTMQPAALAFSDTVPTNQRMGVWRRIQQQVSGNSEMKSKGPMRQAFLIPNPLIPEENFNQRTVDTVILNLNRDLKYGLLSCPAPFSVRVATFRGETTFNLTEIAKAQVEDARQSKWGKPREKSQLAEAGEKAHRLTNELRKLGVEAYEFHDRYESYVCVGAFDWIKRPGPDGRDVWNDDVIKTINDYKATLEENKGIKNLPGTGKPVRPKTLPSLRNTDILFDIQPIPVQVPVSAVGKR